jgi:Flp pilus assembly protein TadD
MLIDCSRPADALDLYNKGLKENPDSTELLYSRALTYDHLNKPAEAESDLRDLLSNSPNNARAMNALGYMLTERGDRYEEARQLIVRALQISPNDPAVIDSMGWVEFKRGHAKDALPYLQKAFDLFPDPEIAAHLGEVLWSTGDKEGARAVWDTALKAAPDDTTVKATIKRLTQ